MARVLLVYAVSSRIQTPLLGVAAPCGLTWIARALADHGHESRICDLSILDRKADLGAALAQAVADFPADYVGVSIRNIDTASDPPMTFYPYLEKVAAGIRAATSVPMVLGGAAFSLFPEECLRRLRADYGVVGEGEEAFPALLKALESGLGADGIPGVFVREGDEVRSTPRRMFGGFSKMGPPLHDGVDYDRYDDLGGYYSVQTKRGCAFGCIYCDYPFLEGKKYRLRDPLEVVDEMEELVGKFKLRNFFFTDSVFNFPAKHCAQILEEIVRRDLKIRWMAYVNPRGLRREMVELWKRSGCSKVEVTADNASEATLQVYKKFFTVDDMLRADRYLAEFEIPTFYWINLGGPGETNETLQECWQTLGKLEQVTRGWLGTGFIVQPGTPLYDQALAEGRVTDLSGNTPYLYLSDELPDDFAEQIQRFCMDNPAWYSRFDRLHDDYLAMVRRIRDERIRDNWHMQRVYGEKRREDHYAGRYPVLSQVAFDAEIQKLAGPWAKGTTG